MKKWAAIIGVVAAVVIIAVVFGLSNLGPAIKSAVNAYGPAITKTEVRLGEVSVSLFSAEAKLKDFFLGNPKGFKMPHAVKVGSIVVDVDEKSLITDTIIIERIEVIRPDITYEKAGGTDNFQAILNNVNQSIGTGGGSSPKQAGKEGGGKKILIKNFIVRGGKVSFSSSLLAGKSIGTPLPDIHLKDIGKEEGGLSPAKAFQQVFASLYQYIASPAVMGVFNDELKKLGAGVATAGKGVKDEIQKGLGGVTGKLKGLFGTKK